MLVRKGLLRCVGGAVAIAALALHAPEVRAFDFDTGNAAFEIVIPNAIPAIFGQLSPTGGDATLVLRATTLITNSWFDAIAPYHPTAVGVYSKLGRRPAEESATNAYKNEAILYASCRIMKSMFPGQTAQWDAMLASAGLDPDYTDENTETPAGIGNAAGNAIVAVREHDGMNQLGDEGGRDYNRQPYADYLGYKPVNTAYEIVDPSRWQPNIVTMGNGLFRVQQFVTPQMRVTLPYSYNNPNVFQAPPPHKSRPTGKKGMEQYRAQADEVLQASAMLTDHQKMTAELFDNKILSLGFSALFMVESRGLTLDEAVHYDFLTNAAAFDTAIAIWNLKYRYDAVRPFTAIRYLYGDRLVTAWGGPGMGTVSDLPASQWQGYLPVADHPEYPSGSAAFCGAHAQASRRYFGSDDFGWSVPTPVGSSRIEPGITPAADIVLGPWPTWSDFEEDCGQSRFWGGVHFQDAITEGRKIGHQVADIAYDFVKAHIDGNVP